MAVHTFCGACAVRFLRTNHKCPEDNTPITGMNDHRRLAEIIEIFLRTFPQRRRDPAEIERMDQEYRLGQKVSL
jgi:hypothetical protein